jgi:hypothetical protein
MNMTLLFSDIHYAGYGCIWEVRDIKIWEVRARGYPPITYYWTGLLILDHSYLVEKLTNSKIAETKAVEPLKS